MPASRGQVWLMYCTIVLVSTKALHVLGKIANSLYKLVQKGEQVMDWIVAVIEKYPDPNVVIEKLGKVNGNHVKVEEHKTKL